MHQTAASYFALSRSQTLDPVVVLLLEALSEEIYKLSGEIDGRETRVSEKLSQLFVPGIDAIVHPAHAVIHATATESMIRLASDAGFVASGKRNQEELVFYPVCNTRLWKGDVRYFAHHGILYAFDKHQNKLPLTCHGKKDCFRENSFWLALELDEAIENLSGLSFYLDMPGVGEKEECLNLWFYTLWSVRGENLPMTGGLFSTGEKYIDHTLELFYEYDYSNRINRSVKAKYDVRFLTLKGDFNPQSKRELIPEKLKDAFSPIVAEDFTIPLLWIEVSARLHLPPESLMSCV
jgi:hypothetical protein